MFPNAQDALPLPRRPNLEIYRQLAKDLVQACKSENDAALDEWAEKWATTLAKQSGIKFIRPLPVIASRWAGQLAGFVQRKAHVNAAGVQRVRNGACAGMSAPDDRNEGHRLTFVQNKPAVKVGILTFAGTLQ